MIAFNQKFTTALPIIEKIQAAGFEAYFVGGCVRDALLNKKSTMLILLLALFLLRSKKFFRRRSMWALNMGP